MGDKDREEDFKLSIIKSLAEINTSLKAVAEKLDKFDERTEKLEHSVFGNGEQGLAEEVRQIKSTWALFYGIAIILISAFSNVYLLRFFH